MTAADWHPLLAELDRWARAGKQIDLWLRDDDATRPSAQLDRLADLSERFAVPVLLATIPLMAQEALARRLEAAPLLRPCQHGACHRNDAPPGEKKSEFGLHRPLAASLAQIGEGADRMRRLFGDRVLPVFVPPWNRIHPEIAAALPQLGFAGLSCFRKSALGPAGGPRLVNTDLDLIDWHGGRVGRRLDQLLPEMVALLAAYRQNSGPRRTFGLLLHHHDHDTTAWTILPELLTRLASHPAVTLCAPETVFGIAGGEAADLD